LKIKQNALKTWASSVSKNILKKFSALFQTVAIYPFLHHARSSSISQSLTRVLFTKFREYV